MPTSLVTGGAGFIGSHVADALIARGHRTIVLDDLSGGTLANVPSSAVFYQGSCTDVRLVERIFARERIDYVFHLAAYAAEGLSHFIRRFNYSNNVLGSITLINAAVAAGCVKTFVFTSSIAVYGAGQTPMHEDMLPRPEDPYGIAKVAVELDLAAAQRMFGLNFIIFRPHNVYGERQNHRDPYRNVIAIFIGQVMRGEPCQIFGDGRQTRAFTHVDDVAQTIASAIDIPGARNQIFNLGAESPYTVLEVAEAIQREVGRSTGIVHLPPRDEIRHAFADHRKAREILGFRETVTLPEGIRRTVAWLRQSHDRPPPRLPPIEVARNLPSAWQPLAAV